MSKIDPSQKQSYSDQFKKFGLSPKSTHQNDTVTQNLRFQRLMKEFTGLQNPTVLDVGSGLSDLHNYLNQRHFNHVYTGVEIVKEMADAARERFPSTTIIEQDILEFSNDQKYDLVVLSGTFNLLAGANKEIWQNQCFQIIDKMFELSVVGISLNFLTSYNTFSKPDLLYFDPLHLFDFCMKKFTRFCHLDHSYPLYEGTITLFHEKFLASQYTAQELKKYFKV